MINLARTTNTSTMANRVPQANALLRNFGGVAKTRKITQSSKLSKQDCEGIVRLYEMLVPRKGIEAINMQILKKFFPMFDDIDVDMIAEEAFPAFERTIGEENLAKVKRYFGIGGKTSKNGVKTKEIEMLVSKLRTIENAQYYICGYKGLIKEIANKLEGAPKHLSDLEKAKIVRMYTVLICGFFYFAEDFSYTDFAKREVSVDYNKVPKNNKMGFYPEELFVLYVSKLKNIKPENLFYEIVRFEITSLEKKLLKDVLGFAELDLIDGEFTSVNVVNPIQTFGSVRNIKIRIHQEPGVFPIEVFSVKDMAQKLDLGDMYLIYKTLKTVKLENFPTAEKPFVKLEGSRIVNSTHTCYEIIKEMFIAGPVERDRFIRIIELLAGKGVEMELKNDHEGKPLKKAKKFNTKQFMAAIIFANEAAYLNSETPVERDFEIATKFIEMDKTGALERYADDLISVDQLKEELGIDATFEAEYFGIKLSHKDIVANYAVQCGYVESTDAIDYSLIEEVFIPGNEGHIDDFGDGIIDRVKFERNIGFTTEFAEMFFCLAKIDIAKIEEKLLEVKRSTTVGQKKIDHRLKMLVLLYCYIVENAITCGPKNRAPKRNKSLKPSNLKNFIS